MKTLLDIFKTRDQKIVLYLGMLLAAGALMMLAGGLPFFAGNGTEDMPGQESAAATPEESETNEADKDFRQERQWERRLEEVFALVEDVGQVRVLLRMQPEKETVYAADSNISASVTKETDAQGGSRETETSARQDKTVLITDKAGEDRPLILREIGPGIAGVIIIAEGGDNVFVKDALTKAACTVLGIEANKVQVLKMSSPTPQGHN